MGVCACATGGSSAAAHCCRHHIVAKRKENKFYLSVNPRLGAGQSLHKQSEYTWRRNMKLGAECVDAPARRRAHRAAIQTPQAPRLAMFRVFSEVSRYVGQSGAKYQNRIIERPSTGFTTLAPRRKARFRRSRNIPKSTTASNRSSGSPSLENSSSRARNPKTLLAPASPPFRRLMILSRPVES